MKKLTFALTLLITLASVWVAFSSMGAVIAQEPMGKPTRTPTITRTPTSTPIVFEDYAAFLRVGLSSIPTIQGAEVKLEGRRRIATIVYISAATDAQTRNDEWSAIFQSVADTIVNQHLTIDQVVLIAVQSQPVGQVTIDGPSLRLFGLKRLSAASLLRRAKFLSLVPTPTPTLRPTRTPRPTLTPITPPTSIPVVQQQQAVPGNGATALCNDGTYSYAANHRGACSHHGGVAQWYK